MQYLNTNNIKYIDNTIFVEKIKVKDLALEFGTPLHIYSYNQLLENYQKLRTQLDKYIPRVKIYYASKANTNISIIKALHSFGVSVDVNSMGEMYKAIKAGVQPKNMIFSGVGKTYNEIEFGIDNNIHFFKCESFSEIKHINDIAEKKNKFIKYAIRINPDVDAHTTSHITTGTYLNKFGILIEDLINNIDFIKSLKNIELKYLAVHLGSQIFDIEPFAATFDKLLQLIDKLKSYGIIIEEIDLGGGLGVSYQPDGRQFPVETYAKLIAVKFGNIDIDISIEPGRYLVANAGILITKLLYCKQNRNKLFYIVDAGMNDMIRPALYESYHHIQPVHIKNKETVKVDVVGPVCESTDAFAKDRIINRCDEDDLLAIMTSGAYGSVLSSNYNGRLRPAEILVNGDKYFVIKRRDILDNLLLGEEIIQ